VRPAVAFALALVLAASESRADTPPSSWDLARDPAERARWALHVRVQQMLAPPAGDELPPLEVRRGLELQLEHACAMLEAADAEHSPDVRLRFDLGIVYEQLGERQERADRYQRAIDVLAPAFDAAPEHPAATLALERLVYAYARLDRPQEELATWRRLIPRLTDDRSRIVDMMNMGEAEMRLGFVDDALGTFREVLRLCGDLPNANPTNSTYVLTLWDLAVALDRSGDPGGALATASKASGMTAIGSTGLPMTGRTIIARDPAVFFVPDWEREWYLALAAAAAARDARDAHDAVALWAEAAHHWETYVTRSAAAGTRDPWLAIARLRKDRVQADLRAAEKRAAKQPRRATIGGAWIDD
jgi:tetratricopeptide (TPR) repeat protein